MALGCKCYSTSGMMTDYRMHDAGTVGDQMPDYAAGVPHARKFGAVGSQGILATVSDLDAGLARAAVPQGEGLQS